MEQRDFKNIGLQQLLEQLENGQYCTIEKLCDAAKKQSAKLNALELQQTTSQYTALCTKLIDEILGHLKFRREVLTPYIQKLSEKNANGHDCSKCTGSCKLQHDMQLLELKESHLQVKNTLSRLQMAVLPLYSETIFPDAYRVLRNQMALLENCLTELFFLEENYLLPKIAEAQNNINAIH